MKDLNAVTKFQELLEEAIVQLRRGCGLTDDQVTNIVQGSLEAGDYPTLKRFQDMVNDPEIETEAVINKLEMAHRGAIIF